MVLIKACLNGSRVRGSHRALPVTASELADDACRAMEAGARAFHLHPRDQHGLETLEGRDCDAVAVAMRRACPDAPFGFSTGAWIEGDHVRRMALIWSWTERPDFASVNFSELGSVELCALLLELGIGIEAGLATVADAENLLDSGYARKVVRVLVEPGDREPPRAEATADQIGATLDRAGLETPRVYHGVDMATWRVIEHGLEGAWDIRVGFEDTDQLPDGSPASSNAELVAAAARIARKRGLLPRYYPRKKA